MLVSLSVHVCTEMVMNSGVLSSILARIHERPWWRKTIANIGWLFVDRLLALAAGLAVGVWVARYLGPVQYGLYSYALAFEALFVPVAGLGLAELVVREVVSAPGEKSTILGTAFALQLITGLLTFALAVSAAFLIHPDDAVLRWLITVTASQLVFQALTNTLDCWFRSQVQSRYVVWSKNIALALVVPIQSALILLKAPLIAFAYAAVAQIVFLAACITVFYHVSGEAMKAWRASVQRAYGLLRDSWPLMLSTVAIAVYMRIGQLMLGHMMGDEDLGTYSAAVRISELTYFVPVAMAASVLPALVQSRQNWTGDAYLKRLQAFYDVMAGAAYLVVIPVAIFATPLVTLLFGPEYAEAGPVLTVHMWAFIFVSLGVARNQWLLTENMTRFSMFATILGAVVSVGLNYLLIPRYAGLGAAWATLASQAVAAYFATLLSARTRPGFRQLTLSLLVPFRLLSLFRSLRGWVTGTDESGRRILEQG